MPEGAAADPGAQDVVEVAVVARGATAVWLCLREDDGGERQVPLRHRVHGIWFDQVPDVPAGTPYGFRADGPWEPTRGQRYNPEKRLLDPFGTVLDGTVTAGPEIFAHAVDDQLAPVDGGDVRSTVDTGDAIPWNLVPDDRAEGRDFDWGDDSPPRVPWRDTLVAEGHVHGLTAAHPEVPEELRGTYAGLAQPPVLEHLASLGVTAVELLPVHAKADEQHLMRRGAQNYWGYNALSWFAPHPGYAATDDPLEVADEFRGMVRAMHEAGLEVILDVVYNHTAEESAAGGPTYSWRGLDAPLYYRLDDVGRDVDHTGCQNTVDTNHPETIRLVLDSLRHWVEEFHVDGFRFDLASALGRDAAGAWSRKHPLLLALRTDPVLSRVKLIAEPWDISPGGWQTGSYPPPMAEWNDRFRDATRSFWLNGDVGVSEMATRLSGSSDLFDHHGRLPTSSVNFVTAHDGFTLHDLTAYDHKHNEENGEDNRDGNDNNRSWNHGVEGPTPDTPEGRAVAAARRRSMRNLLATTLLATGTPMITAGDEFGRTQNGNNNLYTLTDANRDQAALDWDWDQWQSDLVETTRRLVELRRRFHAIGHHTFFEPYTARDTSRATGHDGGQHPDDVTAWTPSAAWYTAAGNALADTDWGDRTSRTLQMVLVPDDAPAPVITRTEREDAAEDLDRDGAADGLPEARTAVVVALHAGGPGEVVVPTVDGWPRARLEWSSAWEHPDYPADDADPQPGEALPVDGPTVIVWSLHP